MVEPVRTDPYFWISLVSDMTWLISLFLICKVKFVLFIPLNCCCCSVTKPCPALYNPMDCSTPGFRVFTTSWSLLKLMSVESVMPSNHLVLCCPLLLPSIFPNIRVFYNKLAFRIRWPKYWSFSISSSNEYSVLISFRIDSFDLLAVQRTLNSLLQTTVQKH